jgi:putative spermidine/putrescine transport system permease protein
MSNAYLAKSMPDSSDQQHQPPMTSEDALAREERKEHTSMLLLLTPALVMVVVLLIMPLCWLAFQSVQTEEGFSGQLHPDFPGKHLLGHLRPDLQDQFPGDDPVDRHGLPHCLRRFAPAGFLGQPDSDLRDPAVLDQRAGAGLCLAGAPATPRTGQSDADGPWHHRPTPTLMHNTTGTVIGTARHAALLVLPLYSVMKNPPGPHASVREPWRQTLYTFRRVFPADGSAGGHGRFHPGVRHLPRLLHHPELLGGGRTILVSMLVQRNVELYHACAASSRPGAAVCGVPDRGINRFIPIERILGARQ